MKKHTAIFTVSFFIYLNISFCHAESLESSTKIPCIDFLGASVNGGYNSISLHNIFQQAAKNNNHITLTELSGKVPLGEGAKEVRDELLPAILKSDSLGGFEKIAVKLAFLYITAKVVQYLNIILNPNNLMDFLISTNSNKSSHIVVGVDLFFWMIYSHQSDGLKNLDAMLDGIKDGKTNYIVSLIPKLSVEIPVGHSSRYKQYMKATSLKYFPNNGQFRPTDKIIDEANKKIQAWADKKNAEKGSNGKVLVMNDLIKVYENQEAGVFECGDSMNFQYVNNILQDDGLHLTNQGGRCLAGLILTAMSKDKAFEGYAKYFDSTKLAEGANQRRTSAKAKAKAKEEL